LPLAGVSVEKKASGGAETKCSLEKEEKAIEKDEFDDEDALEALIEAEKSSPVGKA